MESGLYNSQNKHHGKQGFVPPFKASSRTLEMPPPSPPLLDDILSQMSQRDPSSTQVFRSNCEYFDSVRNNLSSNFLNRPLDLSSLGTRNTSSSQLTKKRNWRTSGLQLSQPDYFESTPVSSKDDTDYRDEERFQDSPELFTQHSQARLGSVTFERPDFASEGDHQGAVSAMQDYTLHDEGPAPHQEPAVSQYNVDTPAQLFIPAYGEEPANTSNVIGLRSITEIPNPFRSVFSKFPYFNIVQSNVFEEVMYTDKPLVVCAPTGSGKTVIFELAIIRLLMNSGPNTSNAKVVYMAPMKALCNERFTDWSTKFEPFGLKCKEVTGDSELDDYFELQNVHVIMTTPEKWDSMTRKWRDNRSLVQSVKLFLIDEVHLLNDDERGATVEAVISRMKTVQATTTRHTADKVGMRLLAISATIPNVEDIAAWLGGIDSPASHYSMDDSHRPVKLRKVVLGFPKGSNYSDFRFDLSLNYKLSGIIQTYSDRKPTLVFCSTRKGTQQAAQTLVKDARFIMNSQHRQRLQRIGNSLHDSKLRELVICGIGYHHAGLDPTDRRNVEAMFIKGDLPVLFATSTLAVGVNLPAHLVIIKSTSCYVMGVNREYSETQILQMIGRAGRPQFDSSATAVILTSSSNKAKYTGLLEGTQNIESSLHHHLIEHLNAEIVLNTITDVSIALEWLKSTFLYIRILKNPTHYGIPEGLVKESLEQKLQDICLKSLSTLEKAGLIKMDDGFDLKPTEPGRLMARYCITYDSMKQLLTVKAQEDLSDMVELISKCKEVCDVKLRVNEKRALNTLNKDKNKQTIRFPINGKIKTTEQKVNCLIQATLGCLPVTEFSLTQDVTKIFRAGQRITRCLTELQMLKSDYLSLHNSIILAKCIKARLWENSKFVSRQLEKVGPQLSTMMVNASLTTFKKIEETNPREIEMIVNRHPPFGSQIREAASSLPKYEVSVQQAGRHQPSRAEIVITVTMTNHIKRKDAIRSERSSHYCILLIADADNKVVHKQRLGDAVFLKEGSWSKRVEVQRPVGLSPELTVNLISQEYVGLDLNTTYTPHYSGTQPYLAIKKESRKNTPQTVQRNASTKGASTSKSTTPRVPCNHRCLNKEICAHECCKQGIASKVKKWRPEIERNDASTRLPLHTKQTQVSAGNRADIGDRNSMDTFLRNLHHRTEAIPGTPAAKRLKMCETNGTNLVDLTLDDRFGYTPKPPYSYQRNICQVKEETTEPVKKNNSGTHRWEEIDWHKRRVKEEQATVQDLSTDERFDDDLPCFSFDELWHDDELALILSDDETFLNPPVHQSRKNGLTEHSPLLQCSYFKPALPVNHQRSKATSQSIGQQNCSQAKTPLSRVRSSQYVTESQARAKCSTSSDDKNRPKGNPRRIPYPLPPPPTPGKEGFEEPSHMGSVRRTWEQRAEPRDRALIAETSIPWDSRSSSYLDILPEAPGSNQVPTESSFFSSSWLKSGDQEDREEEQDVFAGIFHGLL